MIFCSATFTQANTIATLTDLGTKPVTATLAAPTASTRRHRSAPHVEGHVPDPVQVGRPDRQRQDHRRCHCWYGRLRRRPLAATRHWRAATFTVLQDDKAVVPNDVMLPLVTAAAGTLDVMSVIDATSAKLTTVQLRSLKQRLKDGASPELAANEFTGNVGS